MRIQTGLSIPLLLGLAMLCLLPLCTQAIAADNSPEEGCLGLTSKDAAGDFFTNNVWAKVGGQECIKCHKTGGDAEESRFILQDPTLARGDQRITFMCKNLLAFKQMARLKADGKPLLLAKVAEEVEHGGGKVFAKDSTGYRILEEFIQRMNSSSSSPSEAIDQTPFFDGVVMCDDRQLLRRATLSLAGRLPTAAELDIVTQQGLAAMPDILDKVLTEEAFYERLREGFNDIFLTLGVDGNPDQTVLSYEHFEKTRGWYQKFDLSHIEDGKEQVQARYKLANQYRAALLDEPMRLVEYIVRHDRPFTEIATADYIMVSPYTARGYGIFDTIKDEFQDPKDPFEYIPVKLDALIGRNKKENQDSETGFYPHAGLLSTFQYLSRYPTTETNRNRLRARMYYQHFLGVDVLELAARVSDAASVSAKYEVPTMQASECVICHKTLDPVAGLFQDYWRFDRNFAIYGKRHEGWFDDMFSPGFEGESLPEEERWRALQWLGERTVEDPRFATAMTEHAYYLLTGRRPLLAPKDLDDPLFVSRYRAYREQRQEIEEIAARFIESEFNFKTLIKEWILSDFYRANRLASPTESASRRSELEDIGVVRMLSPEQLDRKVAAIFGKRWGRLDDQTAMLYGGIDSKEVTERAVDPSGAMGAIQRILANDVACKNVALDFSRPASERILFANVEPDVIPKVSPEDDARIRKTIVHLHQRILGRYDEPTDPEVQRTFDLFAGIVADAHEQGRFEQQEIWSCRQGLNKPVPDPHYTVRAWRAVVTYLLRQEEFIYE
ncbi:hypothetical protein [Bremerella sp.]|uniref:hypothetical protein n=1 Tax=Bremerella sp. TaxID=2795602 RepID=UPI00391DB209